MPVFNTNMLFPGHVLLAEGISTKLEKGYKVKTWPGQKDIKEAQSFLGLASYYRQFILHFAKKAWYLPELVAPTTNKSKKKARPKEGEIVINKPKARIFEWMMKHQEAFDALKKALSTAPVLSIPASPGNLYWR